MSLPSIDLDYLKDLLKRLLAIHSPTGYTDTAVHLLLEELQALGLETQMTRRGAILATIPGEKSAPRRTVVTHIDTLGAMVVGLKDSGRLSIAPIGTWSARFAEGARVSIFTDRGVRRGTILPCKASGHVFGDDVDSQPVSWENLEVRIDEPTDCARQTEMLYINIGDFIGIDSNPEFSPNGFINSRHLDNKAGVALTMTAVKAMVDNDMSLPVPATLLITLNEEVGSGASIPFDEDVSEMVAIDNGTVAPGQNSAEYGATIAMMDSSGPFDYHLTHRLIKLCQDNAINFQRDVFKYYRCDAAAAVESGNDVRCALVAFGLDASHGYERTHIDSLRSVAQLLIAYMTAQPVRWRDRYRLSSGDDMTTQPHEEAPPTFTHL